MSRVFSGIQPSGNLHLGNYLGAIRSWVELQEKFDSLLFCVVDLHAITVPQDPQILRQEIFSAVATYIACGIDVEKSIIFPQSAVSGHAELCWLLSCITPVGWLNRMTQFKEKSTKNKSLGLYSYPVLMAADILLYKATHVPVGDDQAQHLEITRDIAKAFNSMYSVEHFPLPEMIKPNLNARVMSLKDGTAKMSKSDPSDYARINLSDGPDIIAKKISKAKTDSIIGFDFKTLPERPEAYNLIKIYADLSDKTVESICDQVDNFSTLKKNLTELLISSFQNVRNNIMRLKKEPNYLQEIIDRSLEKVNLLSVGHLREIRNIVGIYN